MVGKLLQALSIHLEIWVAFGLIAACLLAELTMLRIGVDDLDEGYFAEQALRLVHGQLPLRDFETLYTPGQVALHAALFDAIGPSLTALRAMTLASRAALVIVLALLVLPMVRHPIWATLPGLFLLLGLDDAPVRWEPHPGWWSTCFAALAAWCLTRPLQRRWLIAAGAAAAATYAFKQNTGLLVLGAIVAYLALVRRCGPARLAWPLMSFGALTLAWVVPLAIALNGNLAPMAVFVGAVNQGGLFSPPEPAMLIPVACLVAGGWLLKRERDTRLLWLLILGAAVLLTQYPRMDTLHLVWSAPLLLVVGAIVLDRVRPILALLAVALAALLVWPTIASRLDYLAQPRGAVADVIAPERSAEELAGLVQEIDARTQPGQPIFVYPSSPLVYALADRPNPTRFDHLYPGAATPDQIQQVIATLDNAHPRLVVISDFWREVWGPPGVNEPLEAWIDANFSDVSRYGAYRVLTPRL
jgi:hypothetical protein